MDLPFGIRFSPSDEEKVDLLLYKVTGVSVPSHNFIGTCDLYGDKEPWEIFGNSDESELYFFTVLKKVGKKKTASDYKRFSRNVGKGTWSNKGKTLPIYRKRRGGVIGYKKCLRYEPKKGGSDDRTGTWLLKEYSLPEHLQGVKEEYKDCVLCVLKRKGQCVEENILSTSTTSDHVDAVSSCNDIGDVGDAGFLDTINIEDSSWNDVGGIGDAGFLDTINIEDASWNDLGGIGDAGFLDTINIEDASWNDVGGIGDTGFLDMINMEDSSWNDIGGIGDANLLHTINSDMALADTTTDYRFLESVYRPGLIPTQLDNYIST